MQIFAILALCLVSVIAAPNAYGSYDAPLRTVSSYDVVKSLPTMELKKPMIPIVKYLLNDDNYGTYKLEFVSGDGSSQVETGSLKNLGDLEGPVNVKSGSYSYMYEGKQYTVTWTADENGFRAVGDHLPTPPPVPVEIQKSLLLAKSDDYSSSSYAAPATRVVPSYSTHTLVKSSY